MNFAPIEKERSHPSVNPLTEPITPSNISSQKAPGSVPVWGFNPQSRQYGWTTAPCNMPPQQLAPGMLASPPQQPGQPESYKHHAPQFPPSGAAGPNSFMQFNPYQMQQFQAHQAMMQGPTGNPAAMRGPGGMPYMYPMMPGQFQGFQPGMHGPAVQINNVLLPIRPQAIINRPPIASMPIHPINRAKIPILTSNMMNIINRSQKVQSAKKTKSKKRREEEGVTDEEEDLDLEESSEEEDIELEVSDDEGGDGVVKMKRPASSDDLSFGLARSRAKRDSTKKIDYATFDREPEDDNEDDFVIPKEGKVSSSTPKTPGAKKGPRKTKEESNIDDFVEYSDDDLEDHESDTDLPFVEKIITARKRKLVDAIKDNLKVISPQSSADDLTELDGLRLTKLSPESEETEELLYLVKPHRKSYLHLEWVTHDLLLEDRGGAAKINRFMKKFSSSNMKPENEQLQHLSLLHHSHVGTDEELFDPSYIMVDRIIYHHIKEPTDGKKGFRSFYVKWVNLPLDQCTWEFEEDLVDLEGSEGEMAVDKLKKYMSNLEPSEAKKKAAISYASQKNSIVSAAGSDKEITPSMLSLMVGTSASRPPYMEIKETPVYKNDNELRSYQLEGLNWLMFCWTNRQSCIIADEMGLGKTVQSVCFLDRLHSYFHIPGPFLVVAPLSTLPHWKREFEAWTNLRVLVYHGKLKEREIMFDYEFFYRDTEEGLIIPDTYKFDVLLTTYEMALSGIGHIGNIPWKVGIFDEAHRLKNKNSRASEVLQNFYLEHKVLLTGTPLQNSVEELWSLLNFLQPTRFYDIAVFMKEYGSLKRAEDVMKLQELLKPIMLRRLKEDVEKSIPVKEETIIEVELTLTQKRYYRAILERNFNHLLRGLKSANVPNLLNIMMELRKCCIHPFLIRGAEEQILLDSGLSVKQDISNNPNAQSDLLAAQIDLMINSSGKLVLLDKLLKKLKEGGHKVLIFSQMTKCLDILSDLLNFRGYLFERIDGSIRGDQRQAAIDRFCGRSGGSGESSDPRIEAPFIFLLCTRAGGVGINLTAADTVIIFDSDWNPQNDLQAQARCHRIGQQKHVKVYRLITRGTYEREMFDRAGKKLGLDKAILQRMRHVDTSLTTDSSLAVAAPTSNLPGGLSKREVETLLKKGAYGVVMDNDEDAVKFCEEDIDQILERRTTVIKHGATENDDQSENSNAEPVAEALTANNTSLFSKASFTVASNDLTIDINAPDFWDKWGKIARVDRATGTEHSVEDTPTIRSARLRSQGKYASSLKRRRRKSRHAEALEDNLDDDDDDVIQSDFTSDDDDNEVDEAELLDEDGNLRYGHLYSGRGRPKGSRGGGRPKGSRNKPKPLGPDGLPLPKTTRTRRGRGRGSGSSSVKSASKLDTFSHHNGHGAVTLVFRPDPNGEISSKSFGDVESSDIQAAAGSLDNSLNESTDAGTLLANEASTLS